MGRVADCSIQFLFLSFQNWQKLKKSGLFLEFTVHSSLSDTLIWNFGAKNNGAITSIFGGHITKLNTLESSKNVVLHSMIFGFFNFQCLCIKGSKYVDSILNFIFEIQNLYYVLNFVIIHLFKATFFLSDLFNWVMFILDSRVIFEFWRQNHIAISPIFLGFTNKLTTFLKKLNNKKSSKLCTGEWTRCCRAEKKHSQPRL